MSGADKSKPKGLSLRQVRDQLLAVPASRRVQFLVEQPNTRQLLRKLCPQDLLIALHAAGVGDSLELVELLPPGQVQSLVDLESWQRDRINPRALASWLSVLFAANADRALGQVMGLDVELVTLFLKLHTRVFDLSQESSPEATPDGALRTPDERYLVTFVAPPNPDGKEQVDPTDLLGTEVARRIVAGLIAREPFTASRYLEAVRWELPSELEEASLRWRQGRLEDLGYYALYDAFGIYAPVDLSRPPRRRTVEVVSGPDDPDAGLALFVDEYGRAPLLRAASAGLEASDAQRLRHQLLSLANRVTAAQARPPGDVEALAGAVEEVTATLNLGLEYLTRGEVEQARSLLAEVALADIFRTGHTLCWQLSQKARSLRTRLLLDEERSLLSPAVDDLFAALTSKVPRLYAGLVEPGRSGDMPFETLAQLAKAAEVVADTAFAAALLLDVVGLSTQDVDEIADLAVNLGDASELSTELLLATALSRAALGAALEPSPLTQDELAQVQGLCRDSADALSERMCAQIIPLAVERAPLPGALEAAEVEHRGRALCQRLAAGLVDELGAVQETADGRFVTALLCRGDS